MKRYIQELIWVCLAMCGPLAAPFVLTWAVILDMCSDKEGEYEKFKKDILSVLYK
jgi:hypothetical protein